MREYLRCRVQLRMGRVDHAVKPDEETIGAHPVA